MTQPEHAHSPLPVDKFALFGAAVWLWLADQWGGGINEDAWDIAEMSVTAGLSERVRFDPAIHTAEDAEPGDEIIWPIVGDPTTEAVIQSANAHHALVRCLVRLKAKYEEEVQDTGAAAIIHDCGIDLGALASYAERESLPPDPHRAGEGP